MGRRVIVISCKRSGGVWTHVEVALEQMRAPTQPKLKRRFSVFSPARPLVKNNGQLDWPVTRLVLPLGLGKASTSSP